MNKVRETQAMNTKTKQFDVLVIIKFPSTFDLNEKRLPSLTIWPWDSRICTSSHSLMMGVTFFIDFFLGLTLLSDQTPEWFKSCSGYHVPCWTHSIPLHCLWQPLTQTCCKILRDHHMPDMRWSVFIQVFFSFKMVLPSCSCDCFARC